MSHHCSLDAVRWKLVATKRRLYYMCIKGEIIHSSSSRQQLYLDLKMKESRNPSKSKQASFSAEHYQVPFP